MKAATLPASPYKGLAAFSDSDLDALFFFGRDRERRILVANLLASRLTVMYGESGVGKSSLLAAAVVRDLRQAAPGALVELHDVWSGGPEGVLDRARSAEEAYVILDQFEEYFLYHREPDATGSLLHELPELLRTSRAHVLVSLREDSLARLDAFKAALPAVFANQVRLEHLDRDAARSAILGPIGRWNELSGETVEVEDELVGAVLDEVTSGDRVEAPYLQLVLERIWDAERSAGSSVLHRTTLERLGGSQAIVRDHLVHALGALDADEQDVAASMFEHLVTPTGTKIAHRATDLAEYADVREDMLRRVLGELTRDRIVHSVDGSDRYEIFHDVLAQPIRDWRLHRRLELERAAARRRQRRLYAVMAATLLALAAVAGLAAWALTERGRAQARAQHARARELQATALERLAVDPSSSVRLALAAARLEAGAHAEAVLRQALTTDRLRLVRHTSGPVRAVAASPRGDLIAAAVAGGHVLLLDAHNRRLVRTLVSPVPVAGLAFFAGGRRLVTVSAERLAQVWDVGSGLRLPHSARVAGARAPDGSLRLVPVRGALAHAITHVRDLVVTTNGDLLAARVAGADGQVRPWLFTRDGRLRRVLPVVGITDVEFSPDGRLLATAMANGYTILWDARTLRRDGQLRDAKSGVDVVAFSPDGRLIASGAEDGGVRVWDVATGVRLYYLFGHTNPVTSLAWSPDDAVLASGSPDRSVLLWRMRGIVGSGELVATLSGSRGAVRALAFSADGSRLVTGGDEPAVRVWDALPDQTLDVLGRAPGPALAAGWAGHTIVGLWPRVVKTFDARTRRGTHVLVGDGAGRFTSVAASSDGSLLAAGADDGTTLVWDGRTGERLSAHGGRSPVLAVAVAAGGGLVADGARDGTVRVWSRTGALRWSAKQAGPVASVAFSPRGDELVTAGRRGAVQWSVESGRRLHVLTSPAGAVDALFSPDGTIVAAAGVDANARLWFAGTGRLYRVLRGHTKPLTDVAFSDDGRLLAASGKDADVRIWGVHTGRGFVFQRGAFGPIAAVALDSTGRWAAGAAPISVILWSAASGRQLFYVRGHTKPLTDVAFAPEGPSVVTSSRDGTIRTYTCEVCVDLPSLEHIAEVRLAQTR